jgi:hypothetical protein
MNDIEIPKFSNFASRKTLDGDKIKIEEIINKPIVVTGYKIDNSKFYRKQNEKVIKLQFYMADDTKKKKFVLFSGSSVLQEQIAETEEQLKGMGLPLMFETTIAKISNYYAFS